MDRLYLQKQADDIGIDLSNLLSLYSMFIKQTSSDISDLESNLALKKTKAIQDKAHHIKGASLNLELYTFVDYAKSLQALSKTGEWEKINLVLTDLKLAFNELKSFIQKAVNE